jgi:homoserine dehydrogenase
MPPRPWVIKIGGSVLRSPESLAAVVPAIIERRRSGRPLLVVLSAAAGVTDRLADQALRGDPPLRGHALAEFLAQGEERSVQALSGALRAGGIEHLAVAAADLGLIATGNPLDADPERLAPERWLPIWETVGLALVPGFVGRDEAGLPTLLGRGGSDATAIFLAHALGGEAHLIKDEPGLFPLDPKSVSDHPAPIPRLSIPEALSLGTRAVQKKALEIAARHGISFFVTDLEGRRGTWVAADESAS